MCAALKKDLWGGVKDLDERKSMREGKARRAEGKGSVEKLDVLRIHQSKTRAWPSSLV